MKIAIISDIHDHFDNLKKALQEIQSQGITTIIGCGDYCAPIIIKEFAKFKGDFHLVFGNVDGDRFMMTKLVYEQAKDIKMYGELGEVGISGRSIAFLHNHILAEGLVATQKYDAVFYGHTHEARSEVNGRTLFANPGEVAGILNKPSWAVYDTESNGVEFVDID